MTSKEALLALCFKYLPTMYLSLNKEDEKEDEELLNIIQKDLEVLEILKKYFTFSVDNVGFLSIIDKVDYENGDYRNMTISLINNSDKNIIKEWLENE